MDAPPPVDCSAVGVVGFVRGSVLGAVFISVILPAVEKINEKNAPEIKNKILHEPRLRRPQVAIGAAATSLHFALICGAYSGATCALAKFRNKNDWINHGIGGFCIGTLMGSGKGPKSAISFGLCVAAATSIMNMLSHEE